MSWHAKASGGYSESSDEAKENATEIYNVLSGWGWTVNAVAGLLGNIQHEGGMNPWRWQNDSLGSADGSPWTNKGYGFFQFTPAGKYINAATGYSGYGPNFSDQTGLITDGLAQLYYIEYEEGYYQKPEYPISFSEYKASTETPSYLAGAWMYNYERPDNYSTLSDRQTSAEVWYDYLSGVTPTPGTTYTVTVSASTGGTASGGGSYTKGDTATIIATPNSGYTFYGWYEGSSVVSASATYSFTVASNRTLIAYFKAASTDTYFILAVATDGGTVSGGGSYASGATCTLKADALTGYSFTGWYEGATLVSSSTTYSFTVSADRSLIAYFANVSVTYTVSIKTIGVGEVSGAGEYASGDSCTVTATPGNGYKFLGWYVGGSKKSASLSYTFTVNADIVLTAKFVSAGMPLYMYMRRGIIIRR